MKHHRTLAVAFALGTLAAAAPARADVAAAESMASKLLYLLEEQRFAKDDFTSTVEAINAMPTPEACFDTLDGVASDAKIYSDQAFRVKDVAKDGDGKQYLTRKQVEALCKRYQKIRVHELVEAAIVEAWEQDYMMNRPVEGMYPSEALTVGVRGEECAKQVDAALDYGFPESESIESTYYKMPAIALGDAKAKICQPAIDFATTRVAEIEGAAKAKQDAIVAIYKKAGIKGKRLELFVYYGPPDTAGFLAAGCESWVDTVKAMKKAKKLFIWLEGDSGYTIRKYTFKGDSYKVSEKTYSTREGAYAGCK